MFEDPAGIDFNPDTRPMPPRAARSSVLGGFMSLIHTAELHQIEPFDYLVTLQRHVATVALDPSSWMPWNYTEALAHAEAEAAPD